MASPNFESLEATLLRNLTATQAGDEEAKSRVCQTLRAVDGPQHAALLPLIRSVITIDDPDLKLFGACAIGALREAAQPAVPDLIALAKAKDGARSWAAISALGQIPGTQAVEGLVELFEQSDMTTMTGFIGPALKSHGAAVGPYVPRLEAAASLYVGDELKMLTRILNDIRTASRHEQTQDLREESFVARVGLEIPGDMQDRPDEYFAEFRQELPDGVGLVCDERFRFVAMDKTVFLLEGEAVESARDGVNSEVGLQIYRTRDDKIQWVVIFTADDMWYGASPQNVFEKLATAATHIYGLEPKGTLWMERWAASSGHSRTGHDEIDAVLMAYDPETKKFHSPQWKTVGDLDTLLEQLGATE